MIPKPPKITDQPLQRWLAELYNKFKELEIRVRRDSIVYETTYANIISPESTLRNAPGRVVYIPDHPVHGKVLLYADGTDWVIFKSEGTL